MWRFEKLSVYMDLRMTLPIQFRIYESFKNYLKDKMISTQLPLTNTELTGDVISLNSYMLINRSNFDKSTILLFKTTLSPSERDK